MSLEPQQQDQDQNLQIPNLQSPNQQQFTTISDLCFEVQSLQDLAYRGSWRSILDKITRARKLSLLQKPHEHLIYLTYNVLSLTKLRKFIEAAEDLDSLQDLDHINYKYESYPDLYPNQFGSMIPFVLRWIHAEIPLKLGKRQETLDRLYILLDFIRIKLNRKDLNEICVDQWKKREGFVISSILSHHLSNKEFGTCLTLISNLLEKNPEDPVMLSKLGYVQLQLGDIEGSKVSFSKVEELLMKEGDKIEFKNLVNRNKALIYSVGKDYVSAVREYDVCIERDATDVVAINNKALCLMYLRDLSDSIKVLESALERVPTFALNETIVVNLCSMYELAYVNHPDIKKTLSNWIVRVAPDDFDSSCTRV